MSTIELRHSYLLRQAAVRTLPERDLRPDELWRVVRELAADPRVWRLHARHDPRERWHARIYWSPDVEIYLLGWEANQDTRVHDHGDSAGAFCVAEGSLLDQYGRAGATILRERAHCAGSGAMFDSEYVHNLRHVGPAPAVSLHAYSPPLTLMRFYRQGADGQYVAVDQLPIGPQEPADDRTRVAVGADAGEEE